MSRQVGTDYYSNSIILNFEFCILSFAMFNHEKIVGKIIYGGGFVFDFARWLVVFILLLVLCNYFLISIFIVDGASMDPMLKTGEIGVLNKYIYIIDNPKRGDIVVVKYPGDPEKRRYVKRVIGLPGEKVKVYSGLVYVDGKVLKENYLAEYVWSDKDGEWQLGERDYFLMGDNRPNSNDSRYFGPVEQRFILGKTVWILLPRFQSIVTPTYLF
ncbi:MAG: signal peptidase I [Candidatus Berkelbacteria bacterium Athens1014_28]|uniref:Signal peptidase I n=1 Tax=Candidatus Berkelbacteria bacterium Athens1014_28 TaxID=2017145 RepID=A0A554LM03_9BACT|nr:MAG: signal peptidase I [Candidatus Berkelbacteria bacterium Athens1014_28]